MDGEELRLISMRDSRHALSLFLPQTTPEISTDNTNLLYWLVFSINCCRSGCSLALSSFSSASSVLPRSFRTWGRGRDGGARRTGTLCGRNRPGVTLLSSGLSDRSCSEGGCQSFINLTRLHPRTNLFDRFKKKGTFFFPPPVWFGLESGRDVCNIARGETSPSLSTNTNDTRRQY